MTMLVDDLIPKFNPLRAILDKEREAVILAVPHSCLDCPWNDTNGCENCEHDMSSLPGCGEQCNDCNRRWP